MNRSVRLLAIGEFSSATQLSAKALRLYDEAGVLRPASVAASGYRFYSREQVVTGRLVRRLRDMDLPLAAIAEIVAAPRALADAQLGRCAQQIDQRYARQKRAFQAGLALLHGSSSAAAPGVLETGTRARCVVLVQSLETTRAGLVELLRGAAHHAALQPGATPFCRLVEPLGEEASRIELAIPVDPDSARVVATELLHLPQAACVLHTLAVSALADLEAALDAMFDWLDRRGASASEVPCIALLADETALQINWAWEPAPPETTS
jgi:DNA-binding transcriptional MerR regulator